jgi:hypothetical protein
MIEHNLRIEWSLFSQSKFYMNMYIFSYHKYKGRAIPKILVDVARFLVRNLLDTLATTVRSAPRDPWMEESVVLASAFGLE